MKKILIITQYVSMPGEKSNGRFRYLADLLAESDNSIEIITTNFSHRDKKHRTFDQSSVENLNYKFTMLEEPGYKKNVSLKRFYSHHVFAKRLKKYLNEETKPDIIYCAIPSLDVAKVASDFAKKNNIRFVIDVQDLWPEAFKMVFNIPILSTLIFYPMQRTADKIYASSDEIVAVSETYANRAKRVNKKSKNELSVFLGTDLSYFDMVKEENKIEYTDDKVRLVYIGTLGHSYDLKFTIDALEILKNKGIDNIKFVIMGSGPLKEQFENYAKDKKIDYEFTGRLDYGPMVGRLCSCDIAVNPISKGAAQSIINKVGDYAAAGLPVVNTQECEEYRNLVEEYNFGYNCDNNNPEELAEKIEMLYNDKSLRSLLRENNRKLAEEKFDRRKTYKEIVKLLEE